jgi:hypothetical protein
MTDPSPERKPVSGAIQPGRHAAKPYPYQRFIFVKDDFYDEPRKVFEQARMAEYFEPEGVVGFRSRTIYHEEGIKTKLQNLLGIEITYWGTLPEHDNGVFYRTHADEIPGIHSDQPINDITVLVYLTPALPAGCGTSFWMHKNTGLCDPPTPRDARKLKTGIQALRHTLALDSKKRNRWSEIDRIGYRFNRLVAFPSGVLHSATQHYGSSIKDGRLFQAFRIGVDWSSFRLSSSPTSNGSQPEIGKTSKAPERRPHFPEAHLPNAARQTPILSVQPKTKDQRPS